jgi:hypothetical protein
VITDSYTEFVEGAVQAHLDKRKHQESSQVNAQSSSAKSQGWYESISGMLKTVLDKLGSKQTRSQSQSQGPNTANHGSLGTPLTPTTNRRTKYLKLCISRYRRYEQTSYSSHDLQVDSDRKLYEVLRSEYRKLIGYWGRLFTLRRINCIRFVMVSFTYCSCTLSHQRVVPPTKNRICRDRDSLRNARTHPR